MFKNPIRSNTGGQQKSLTSIKRTLILRLEQRLGLGYQIDLEVDGCHSDISILLD